MFRFPLPLLSAEPNYNRLLIVTFFRYDAIQQRTTRRRRGNMGDQRHRRLLFPLCSYSSANQAETLPPITFLDIATLIYFFRGEIHGRSHLVMVEALDVGKLFRSWKLHVISLNWKTANPIQQIAFCLFQKSLLTVCCIDYEWNMERQNRVLE